MFGRGPERLAAVAVLLMTPLGAAAAESADAEMEEVIVTGTQIKGAQIGDVLPVSVIDAEEIEAMGINSGDELLEFIAEQGQNFFSESENISGGVTSARGDIGAFNLRNVGTGNTLVLVNGRRLVNAASYQTELVGGSFVPVNTVNAQSMPVTGLQRVEVLRDGASAIYGADAVAGVVNYVMKNDFEGFKLSLRLDDYESLPRDDVRVTFQWGKVLADGQTRFGVFGNYFDRDRVNSQDDPRWANSDFRSRLDPDSPYAATTLFRNNSVNSEYGQYDLISSASAAGLSGVLTDSRGEFETYPSGDARCQYEIGFGTCGAIDGQGTFRHNLNESRDLYSDLERINVYAYLNHDFDNGAEAFADFSYYSSRTNTRRHGSAKLGAVAAFTIAADHFYNPLGPCGSPNRLPDSVIGTDVPCSGLALGIDNYRFTQAPRIVDNDGETYRLLAGVRWSTGDWDWEAAVTRSVAQKEDITHNRVSNTLMQEALNDTTAAAFNPFSGRLNTNIERALIDVRRNNETTLFMADIKVTNPNIFDLPAGPVGFLAGLEYRSESFEDDRDPRLDGTIQFVDNSGNTFPFISDVTNSSPTPDSEGDRDITSAFFELGIPVLDNLDVQLAVRYEDFSDVGNTTVGKFGFGYRPIEQVLIRGSWSEAFRAPNLVTINEAGVARSNTLDDHACFFVDPNEDTLDCRYSIQRTAQGSRDLQPEGSTNTSIGIVIEPLDNVTFTVDYWKIDKDDTIGLFGEANHLALELLQLIQAGTANCAAIARNPAVVRGVIDDPAEIALYTAAGICPVGQAERIDDAYANLDTRTLEGIDVGISFDFDTKVGNFDFRIIGTFLEEYEQEPGGAAANLVSAQNSGELPSSVPVRGFQSLVRRDGNPNEKWTARARWNKGPFAVAVNALRIGDFIQTSLNRDDGTVFQIPSMTTVNVSADYKFEIRDVKSRVRIGVNNVDDERAPLADDSFGYFADQHRDLGRYYYADFQISL